MINFLMVVVGLLLVARACGPAQAQQTTVYGPSGSVVGRVTTDSQGSRTIYGADGRVTGRTATDSQGTTVLYGADGRRVGSYSNGRK